MNLSRRIRDKLCFKKRVNYFYLLVKHAKNDKNFMKDTYKTIANESIGEFKDKGSKFIAYTTPLDAPSSITTGRDSIEADFPIFIDKIKKMHPKSRHACYAWRLGMDGNRFRANDDGEPSGTAGRPILGQIDSFGLTNVGVVVVRYFGGTLLGTSGLIQAYREATAEAFKNAEIVERIVEDIFEIQFNYDKMPDVMNALKRLTISIRQRDSDEKILQMRALIMKISVEEAILRDNTEGVLIEKL
jgi:uncharacterized YigZ family protein